MKKQMLLALWLPLIAITIFTACKKTVTSGSYEVRQYGTYQFGAAIDGVEFIPVGDPSTGINPINAGTRIINDSTKGWYMTCIQINQSAGMNEVVRKTIECYIKDFKGIGTYKFEVLTNLYPLPRPNNYGAFIKTTNSSYGPVFENYITNFTDTGFIKCKDYSGTGNRVFEFKYDSRSTLNLNEYKAISGVVRY